MKLLRLYKLDIDRGFASSQEVHGFFFYISYSNYQKVWRSEKNTVSVKKYKQGPSKRTPRQQKPSIPSKKKIFAEEEEEVVLFERSESVYLSKPISTNYEKASISNRTT
jgi:hypothetical protein